MMHESFTDRRRFLSSAGMGFSSVALAAMLQRDGLLASGGDETWTPPTGQPHFPPKIKRIIWLFMVGGTSHVESFDPKPMLDKYDGKSIEETPFKKTLDSPHLKKNLREFVPGNHKVRPKLMRMQTGFKKRGQSGIEISDWWPHVGSVVDDIAIVRSMWTTDNDHGAQLQFHTGRHALEGPFPTIGSWVRYGLGSLNDDLPSFVVLGKPLADCCGGQFGHGSNYLGPEFNGVPLSTDPDKPLPFLPRKEQPEAQRREQFDLIRAFNAEAAARVPDDPVIKAKVKSYELAFRMQTAVPDVMRINNENDETRKLYGLDQPETKEFGRLCLAARRLSEKGVRFVQVFHGSNGGAGDWDSHSDLKPNHTRLCKAVDQPIAALVKDLKRRGLLDETLVVWGTEFGRTPGAEGGAGRDHHPYGFSIWLAGGGVKKGVAHGATDEVGFHAVEHRHYVTDLHATVLQLMGLDPRRLALPGRKRLEIDFGTPIQGILS
jgi:hypothetical protein